MAALPDDIREHYKKEAESHAEFLAKYVFKPAFMMAFVHGAKHCYEDIKSGRIKVEKEEDDSS